MIETLYKNIRLEFTMERYASDIGILYNDTTKNSICQQSIKIIKKYE